MDVVSWVLGAVGLFVLAALVVMFGALVSVLCAEGRVGPDGASGRVRWGVIGIAVDPGERFLVIRLLGLRVVRTPLRRDPAKPVAEVSAEPRPRNGRRDRLPLASYRRLARTVWPDVRRMVRHLHVDRLRIEAVIASDDPAWTGEAFGLGCAVLGAVRRAWPHADVRLGADFTTAAPRGAAELAVRLRPVNVLPGAVRVGWALWRERRRSRRGA